MRTAGESGSDIASACPADLQRSSWLGRFSDETEAAYRVWLADRIVPLVWAISVPSVALWLMIPFVWHYALGEGPVRGIWWAALAVNLPTIIAELVVSRTSLRRFMVLWATITTLVVGGATLYSVRFLYPSGPGDIAVVAIFFALLPQFVKLPTRSSAVVAAAFLGTTFAWTVIDVGNGDVELAGVWVVLTTLFGSFFVVIGVSLVGEQESRDSYAAEQTIARQQVMLHESRRLIRRYVPTAVVDQIETGHSHAVDTPARRRVTVLFSDVVGFTSLADRLDPETLAQVINEYLAMVAQAIEDAGGTLNEFAGDGFMSVFGAPATLEPEDQVMAALQAAEQIHTNLSELGEHWYRLGVDQQIQTRIGINTGVLSVGTFGSAGRATYTAIGLPTNIAARIQAQCEPGKTLLSQSSWHLVKHRVAVEPRGEVTVKGVHFPISLFERVDPPEVPGASHA